MSLPIRLLLIAVAGAVAGFGHAPYDIPLFMAVGLAVGIWLAVPLLHSSQAALAGWTLGFGYFMHTLQWIVSPFLVDAARHGWMAPFALVLLAGGLALFWGGAFWGARKLSGSGWALVLTWPAAEMLRGYILTGFPWAMPAQATVDVMAGQVLALVGPYGLNLLLIASAVALTMTGKLRLLAGPVLAAILILPPMAPQTAPLTTQTLRMIQPNVPQHEKWDPEKIYDFYNRQLTLTAAPADVELAAVIWPETAIPWALDLAGTALQDIAAAANGTPVMLGVQRRQDLRYFNTAVVLDAQGGVAQRYDKHHLVPFGEYLPMGDLLADFGISGLAAREGQGYSAGPGAALLDMGALGHALPLICYEAVFPHDVNAAPKRPDWMVQITNDAWFGRAAGPLQHLAQARMRAIEQGLPLARSANTGVSAMIDPWGRVTAYLALNTAGYLDASLPQPRPPTLYSRTGDLPLALLLGLLIAGAVWRRRSNTD